MTLTLTHLAILLLLNLLAPLGLAFPLLYIIRSLAAQRRLLDAQRGEAHALISTLADLAEQLAHRAAGSAAPPRAPASPHWAPPPAVKIRPRAALAAGSAISWRPRPGVLPPGHPHCPKCQAPSPFHEPACTAPGGL